ncbi:MAG: DUF547 domain-containing protein [Cyclobacteriaceae bacterium]
MNAIGQSENFFDTTDRFLKQYVDEGKVDYKSLVNNRSLLDSLIVGVSQMNLNDSSDAFKKAFYIDSYNLLVIKGVLDNYPISSPLDVKGFFKEKKQIVANTEMTLDELEFGVLFNLYRDLRFHFVLNCGAKSCPTLFSRAIRPDGLESQLNFSTIMVMDRDDFVLIDYANDKVIVSRIFEWYRDMFEDGGTTIRRFINDHRFETLPSGYEIVFDEYDWRLNQL